MTPSRATRDYGCAGRLGLGTPQANPTVEAEMRRLMPRDVEYFTVRLTSASEDSAERLREYLEHLPVYLARYATLKLDGFMFACTASSYLATNEQVASYRARAEQALGAGVILAADAVEAWLHAANAGRIGLLSPYPEWLHEQAVSYWRGRGFDIVAEARVDIGSDDTAGIYAQPSARAADALSKLQAAAPDAYLLAGTGMPTLPLVRDLADRGEKVVSSNLALASAGLALLGKAVSPPSAWWGGAEGAEQQ